MKPPYLSAQKWIEEAKNVVRGKNLKDFFVSDEYGGHYLVPVTTLDWSDLKDEVYGDQDPMSYEKKGLDFGGNVTYRNEKIHEDDFNMGEDFSNRMMPEIRKVLKDIEGILGGEYFYEGQNADEAYIDLYFTDEDVKDLIAKGFPFKSELQAILADAKKTFAEFEGPLFERATVSVDTMDTPDGKQIPDPSTAKLSLPDITVKESQAIDPEFTLSVKQSFEDKYATKRSYEFKFRVYDVKFSPQPNGLARPLFKAELKEYKNA